MSHAAGIHDLLRLDVERARVLQLVLRDASVELRRDGVALHGLLDDAVRLIGGDRHRPVVGVRRAAESLDALSADLHRRLVVVDEMTTRAAAVDALTAELAAFGGPPDDAGRAALQQRRYELVVGLLGGDERLALRVVAALGSSSDLAEAVRRTHAAVVREARIDEAVAALGLTSAAAAALVDRLDANVADLVALGFPEADAQVVVAMAEHHGVAVADIVAQVRLRHLDLFSAFVRALFAHRLGVTAAQADALTEVMDHFVAFDGAGPRRADGRITADDLRFVVAEPCFFTAAQVRAAEVLLADPVLFNRLDTAHDNDDVFGDADDASPAGFGSRRPGDGLVSEDDLRSFVLKAQLHSILREHRDAIDIADDPSAVVDGYRSEADFRAFLEDTPDLAPSVREAVTAMLDAGWYDESWWQQHKDELALGAALVAGGVVIVASGGTASWVVVGGAGAAAAGATTVAINLRTDDELFEDVLTNAGRGFFVGVGVSSFAGGLVRYGEATGALARLAGVAEATGGASDVVVAGGIDALLAEDWEQPVKDWVEPIGHVASAVEVGADAIIDRLPMATYETIEEQLAALETQISRQRQVRHVEATATHGGYLADQEDAQRVLDAVHDGRADILGRKAAGHIVVRVDDVAGTHVSGGTEVVTNVFMVKGTASPSVVPTNPNWSPDD